VIRLYEAFEGDRIGMFDSGPADLEAALAQPHVVRDENVLLLDGDEVVGTVWLVFEPAPPNLFADIAVLPGEGERDRLDTAVRHLVAAGHRYAEAHPDKRWTLRCICWTHDSVLSALFEGHGLVQVRQFFRMRISSDSPAIPAAAPPLPDGVEISCATTRDPTRSGRSTTPFADHWNFEPTSTALVRIVRRRDHARPDGWWLLWSTAAGRDLPARRQPSGAGELYVAIWACGSIAGEARVPAAAARSCANATAACGIQLGVDGGEPGRSASTSASACRRSASCRGTPSSCDAAQTPTTALAAI
jgi:hypothetical protein